MSCLEISNEEVCFQLPATLLKSCAIRTASILWEQPDIKKDLEDILVSVSRLTKNQLYEMRNKSLLEDEKFWRVAEKALQPLESLELPASLTRLLSEFIIFMGKNIYQTFYGMICDNIKFDSKFLKNIFFTKQGLVDKYRMYKEWKKDVNFPNFNDDPEKNIMIASWIACAHGDFDFLCQVSLEKVVSAIQLQLGCNIRINTWNRAVAVIIIWHISLKWTHVDQRTFNTFFSTLLENPNYSDGEDKLFSYCVIHGYEKAAEYFYQKLNELDKKDVILSAARQCITSFEDKRERKEISEEYLENIAGVMLYLMKKMSSKTKKIFLTENMKHIFFIFLKTWPYQYLCTELLDYIWVDLSRTDKSSILSFSLKQLYEFSTLRRHNIFRSIHQKILKFLLRKTPEDLKVIVFIPRKDFLRKSHNELFELFKKSDFSSLKMIINDPDLLQHRKKLMDFSVHLTDYVLKETDFESVRTKLDKYMEVLEFSSSEKDELFQILNNISFFKNLVRLGHLSTLNELMRWIYDSDDEKINVRSDELRQYLDPKSFYVDFIDKADYSSAETYLKWQFKGCDEDLENFKTSTISNEFICEKCWFLWIKTFISNGFQSLISRFECFKLLEHFFKTQDELDVFRKEVIVENENCIKMYCHTLMKISDRPTTLPVGLRGRDIMNSNIKVHFGEGSFVSAELERDISHAKNWDKMVESNNIVKALNDALTFCSDSFDKISGLKQSVKDDIDWWLDFYGINGDKFLILDALISWVGFEEYEKRIFIKNFLESSKGASLFLKMFTCTNTSDKAKRVFKCWVLQFGDVEKIFEEVGKLEGADQGTVQTLRNTFDRL